MVAGNEPAYVWLSIVIADGLTGAAYVAEGRSPRHRAAHSIPDFEMIFTNFFLLMNGCSLLAFPTVITNERGQRMKTQKDSGYQMQSGNSFVVIR